MNRNLALRIASAAVLLPVVVFVIHTGGWWVFGLLLAAGAIVLNEYGRIVSGDDAIPRLMLVGLGTVVSAVAMLVRDPVVLLVTIQLSAVAFAIAFTLRTGDMTTVWKRLSASYFGVAYVALAHAAIFRLRAAGEELPLGNDPSIWLYLVLAATWGNDTLAYFAGRGFGKHKLYAKVSPKKTWEGFAGGAVGSLIVPLGLVFALRGNFPDVTVLDVLFIGGPAAALAPLGDLAESLLKRSFDTKDSGGILPGHGGLLDRVDAVYFVAPWALLYITAIRPLLGV